MDEKREDSRREWLDLLLTKEGRRAIEVFTRNIMQNKPSTRGLIASSTVGCRWWQLVYAILVSLPYPPRTILAWSKGINSSHEWKTYQEMIEITSAIVQQIEANPRSTLYRILYGNQVIECNESGAEEPCLRRIDSTFIDSAEDGRYYVCTYDPQIIRHYFIIERRAPSWYISSSYGSEWVRVPVQTLAVPEEELRVFLDSDTDLDSKKEFFVRYFLEGGLPTRYSENEPKKLHGKYIPRHMGQTKELEVAMSSPLHIGYIESMEEYIRELIRYTVGGKATAGKAVGGKLQAGKGGPGKLKVSKRKGKTTMRNRRLNGKRSTRRSKRR